MWLDIFGIKNGLMINFGPSLILYAIYVKFVKLENSFESYRVDKLLYKTTDSQKLTFQQYVVLTNSSDGLDWIEEY